MKKIVSIIMVAVLVLSLSACSSASDKFTVALVTDTGGIDDKSFNQGTHEGILAFVADHSEEAEETYAASTSEADYIPNLSTFAEDKVDLIIAPGYLFGDAIAEVAANFPDQKFLIIDMVVSDRDNVASAVFAEEQGSYLVGIAAGKAAQDAGATAVGFVGGMEGDLIGKFEAGYTAGVHEIDPNIEVMVDYIGDFVSADIGQQLANKMYSEGAYVIYQAAGSGGNGVISEAKKRRLDGQDVWAIGVDRDQYDEGLYDDENSAVLTSMMKRVDTAAYDVSEAAFTDSFPGGEILVFNLENNGVDIPAENPNLSDEIVALIADYKEKVKSGEIEVPTVPGE